MEGAGYVWGKLSFPASPGGVREDGFIPQALSNKTNASKINTVFLKFLLNIEKAAIYRQ